MNKKFQTVGKLEKFKGWLIRQYFNKEKNSQDPWFDVSINETNVLEYISNPKNNFPLTPAQIIDMWACINSFKKKVKKTEKEISDCYRQIKNRERMEAEHTLETIGDNLGGITATMINRLISSGMDKFKTLTFSKHFDDMTEEESMLLEQAIEKFRKEAARRYLQHLRKSQGNLNILFDNLVKEQVMTNKETDLIQPEEYDIILQLYASSDEEVMVYLLSDIERDDNKIKSYQSLVSRQTFPTRKRGRPRKII